MRQRDASTATSWTSKLDQALSGTHVSEPKLLTPGLLFICSKQVTCSLEECAILFIFLFLPLFFKVGSKGSKNHGAICITEVCLVFFCQKCCGYTVSAKIYAQLYTQKATANCSHGVIFFFFALIVAIFLGV